MNKVMGYPKPKKFNFQSYLKRGSKYGNNPVSYKGRTYHSAKEAQYAMVLDALVMDGSIVEWKPQFTLRLDVNEVHVANYIVDFWVRTRNGNEELHEVKGYETDVFKLKWRLAQALYKHLYKFILIK